MFCTILTILIKIYYSQILNMYIKFNFISAYLNVFYSQKFIKTCLKYFENKKDKIKVRILYNLYACVLKHVFINICE